MRRSIVAIFIPLLPLIVLTQVSAIILTRDDLADDYRGATAPFALEGKRWIAIFADGDSTWVETVHPEWIVEGQDDDRSFMLSAGQRKPILLVADVPDLVEGRNVTIVRYTTELPDAGSPLEIAVGTNTYSLTLVASDPPACGGAVTLAAGERSQELYSTRDDVFSCDEPHFDVNWAGDLDGDGSLDLVTNFSGKYSYHPRRLYLSSAAGPNEIVGQVALYDGS